MSQAEELEALLEFLRQNRGFDFTGYKRASLARRIDKRLQAVGVKTYTEYADYLEVHQDEFSQLFNTILINVTSFFRDPAAWELLAKQALTELLAARGRDAPIRVWSAGCASGEEAYTVAIVLAEALGKEAYARRVKIYATDVDEDALAIARQAHYPARSVAGLPPKLVEKYFEIVGSRYVFDKTLRRSVIFGRHDLLHDAPISRIDLLVCRNTIMYFNAETQTRVLARFNFALNEGGILFLGKAEVLLTHRDLFTPIDLKRRIFARAARFDARDRLLALAQNAHGDVARAPAIAADGGGRLRTAAFESGPVAQIVVDTAGTLALANDRARSLFGIGGRDIGRSFHELEVSYRPVELRSCLEKAYSDKTPVVMREVARGTSDGEVFYDVQVLPLSDGDGGVVGADISFFEVTQQRRLREDLKATHKELEAAYEELQSTSEELETTNEELQSTNEELQTMNDELRQRSDDLNQVNGFLTSILTSLRAGVVVIDKELHVQVWNYKAEDMWGLRSSEVVGKNFLNLDIGLPVESLRPIIRTCLAEQKDHQTTELPATNRRGRKITCKVTCSRLTAAGEARGVILLMEELEKDSKKAKKPERRVAAR